jgi:hypothetical protein
VAPAVKGSVAAIPSRSVQGHSHVAHASVTTAVARALTHQYETTSAGRHGRVRQEGHPSFDPPVWVERGSDVKVHGDPPLRDPSAFPPLTGPISDPVDA